MVETKRRVLEGTEKGAVVLDRVDIQPRWNYDVKRQLKDLETRQRWTKARTMGRVQHDNVGRNAAKTRGERATRGNSSRRDKHIASKKGNMGRKLERGLSSRNIGSMTRSKDTGSHNEDLQARERSRVAPGNKACFNSKESSSAGVWNTADQRKATGCQRPKGLHRQSGQSTKVADNNQCGAKRNAVRTHILSLGKGDASNVLSASRTGSGHTPNDCIIIYEGPKKMPQPSSNKVRLEVIYSKERLKRSENTAQLGRGSSGKVLYANGTSCISRYCYNDAETCQPSTGSALYRSTERDDLHEFFRRRPTKSVKEIEVEESKGTPTAYSIHHQCKSKGQLPNRMLPMEVGRISESASLIILNPEALKTMSFTCFCPRRNRN